VTLSSAPGCDKAAIGQVKNGVIKAELEWAKLTVDCLEDYETHEAPVVVCNKTTWNSTLPQCYRKIISTH